MDKKQLRMEEKKMNDFFVLVRNELYGNITIEFIDDGLYGFSSPDGKGKEFRKMIDELKLGERIIIKKIKKV